VSQRDRPGPNREQRRAAARRTKRERGQTDTGSLRSRLNALTEARLAELYERQSAGQSREQIVDWFADALATDYVDEFSRLGAFDEPSDRSKRS
jgi:hypothetical protein